MKIGGEDMRVKVIVMMLLMALLGGLGCTGFVAAVPEMPVVPAKTELVDVSAADSDQADGKCYGVGISLGGGLGPCGISGGIFSIPFSSAILSAVSTAGDVVMGLTGSAPVAVNLEGVVPSKAGAVQADGAID